MIEFDFITDDWFRALLFADCAEFRASQSADAWKSALVLLGVIVEAFLVHHLVSNIYHKRVRTDPRKLQLGVSVLACQKENILSGKAAALPTVVQKYGDLIHSARPVRSGETTSKRRYRYPENCFI